MSEKIASADGAIPCAERCAERGTSTHREPSFHVADVGACRE
jgi:hypothetical protein